MRHSYHATSSSMIGRSLNPLPLQNSATKKSRRRRRKVEYVGIVQELGGVDQGSEFRFLIDAPHLANDDIPVT